MCTLHFSCVTEVSCAVLCCAERYRLQSDHMEALVLFAEELLERLSNHFHGRVRNTTHRQTDRFCVVGKTVVVGYWCKGSELCDTSEYLALLFRSQSFNPPSQVHFHSASTLSILITM